MSWDEQKLLQFFEQQQGAGKKSMAEVKAMLREQRPAELMASLQRRFGLTERNTPHLFDDNELSIDAVSGERIEVLGPASGS